MGSIERYSSDGGRRYRVRYRDPERRSKAKAGFLTRREAEAFLNAVSTSVAHGAYIDPTDARAAVGDLGPEWLAAQTHLKPSSYATLETAWRVYVAPRWGGTEVGRIRHSDVQAWVAQLIKGTAPSIHPQHPLGATSVIRAYGVLASILDTAVRDRRLSANPARGVHLPRKHGKRHAYLSHQQVEMLARYANDKGTLVRFLAYTGLRWGEAVALHVRDVDFGRRRVSVVENAVRVGGRIIVGTPKSHHARRVPIPPFLAAELAERCRGKSSSALVFGDGIHHLNQPTVKGGWWVQAIARAQAADPGFPTPTIHDLRHTAASLAVSAGANVKAVQRMLGHASASMTLDVYADLFDEDIEAVSVALDRARSAEVVQFSCSSRPQATAGETRDPRRSEEVGP
ncbi:site-specific integrase [Amnibacterium soli]|uniref:Site-specific integrase n=1 Tax=Amnibacterium soli TaxID=1282736 RepID=A0ABP8YS22_9MICO